MTTGNVDMFAVFFTSGEKSSRDTKSEEKSTERGKQFCSIKSHSGNSSQGAEKFLLLILTCFLSDCLAWLGAHFLSSFTYGWNVFFFTLKTPFLGETISACSFQIEIEL